MTNYVKKIKANNYVVEIFEGNSIANAVATDWKVLSIVTGERSLNLSNETTDERIADKDNLSKPALITKTVTGKNWELTGSAFLDADDELKMYAWVDEGSERTIRLRKVAIDKSTGAITGLANAPQWVGNCILADFNVTMNFGSSIEASYTISAAAGMTYSTSSL